MRNSLIIKICVSTLKQDNCLFSSNKLAELIFESINLINQYLLLILKLFQSILILDDDIFFWLAIFLHLGILLSLLSF